MAEKSDNHVVNRYIDHMEESIKSHDPKYVAELLYEIKTHLNYLENEVSLSKSQWQSFNVINKNIRAILKCSR